MLWSGSQAKNLFSTISNSQILKLYNSASEFHIINHKSLNYTTNITPITNSYFYTIAHHSDDTTFAPDDYYDYYYYDYLETTTIEAPTTTIDTTESSSKSCHAVGVWRFNPGMDDWCTTSCNHIPPHCPVTHCTCDWNTLMVSNIVLWKLFSKRHFSFVLNILKNLTCFSLWLR